MADGSLKFDTKIDTDGFEKGIGTLTQVMERLIVTVEDLSGNIKNAFSGANMSGVSTAVEDTKEKIDSADGSAKRMEESMKNVDAAIERMNAEPAEDIIPDTAVENTATVKDNIESVSSAVENMGQEVASAADQGSGKTSELNNMFTLIKQTVTSMPGTFSALGSGIASAFSQAEAPAAGAQNEIQKLVDKIDTYKDSMHGMEQKGLYFGDTEYDKAYSELTKAEAALNKYKKGLAGTDTEQKKVTSSAKKLGSSIKSTAKSSAPLTKSILKLSSMFKLLVLRMAMRTAIKSVQEGFQNLAQYSNQANKDMSTLKTSMLTLKNSFATAFAPILTAITPALQTLIGYLSQAISVMGQFFAVLFTGATTFTKAKDAQVDYAKSLKKTAKEANNSLSPIDKLNNVSDSAGGAAAQGQPDPSQMFEEVKIDSKLVDMVKSLKEDLVGLFDPIKQSWSTYGQPAIDSAKAAFGSIKTLLIEVGDSFRTVWLNGTGTETIDNILLIFTNINNTISSIAENFKTAWVTDGTGTQILQNIWDIINNILDAIQRMAQATAEWASGLDFTPILTSFENLTASLEPLTGTIADGLVWFYENVLLPIAGWVITDVIPLFFDGLAAVLDILNNTLEALEPLGTWLFDNFLQPLAEWTGGIITEVLGWIVDKLKEFGDWIKDHQEAVETFAIVVGSFAAAWGLVNAAIAIWNIIGVIATGVTAAFAAAVAFLTSPIGIVVLAIGALIAIIVLLVKNWDKVKETASKCWEGIKNAWNKAGEWFNTKIVKPIGNFFTDLWDGLKTGAKNALGAIKNAFKTVFTALIDIVKTPVNAIIDIINGMISGVVSGVNAVIRAINSISFTIPDWVPGIGGKGIGFNIKEFNAPKIPKLATGTVVPTNYGEFLSILGDNPREPEVVSPLSTIKQAVKEAMAESGGAGGGEIHIWLEGDAKGVFKLVRVAENENYRATNKQVFVHG